MKYDRADHCAHKTKYSSQRKAKTGVRLLRLRGEDCHAYFCVYCKGWHVGHNAL